jgi:hypothetical protein
MLIMAQALATLLIEARSARLVIVISSAAVSR